MLAISIAWVTTLVPKDMPMHRTTARTNLMLVFSFEVEPLAGAW